MKKPGLIQRRDIVRLKRGKKLLRVTRIIDKDILEGIAADGTGYTALFSEVSTVSEEIANSFPRTVDDECWCHVRSLHYDFENHVGNLYLDKGHCVDMGGAIRVFERIHTTPWMIIQAGDIEYFKENGKWFCTGKIVPEERGLFGDAAILKKEQP